MKKTLLSSFTLRAFMLVMTLVGAVNAAWADEVTVTKTMAEVSTENNWTQSAGNNAVCYKSFELDENITVSTSGEDNCGSFWGSDWRLYQNKSGDVTIAAADGCTLTSVTITYTTSNNGQLEIESGTATEVSGSSVTYHVSSNGTKGQVRITAISVTYETAGSTPADTRFDAGLTVTTQSPITIDLADATKAPTAQIEATKRTTSDITYTSSNEEVATVDANGLVTAVAVGEATITIAVAETAEYKAASKAITVKVIDSTPVEFAVKDGVFDFVNAATAGEDYGSGEETTSDGKYYTTEAKTWTAGNVTLVTDVKYRWWSNGGTLRFYQGGTLTFSVPAGKVITKIVFDSTNLGNLSAAAGSYSTNGVWEGEEQSVTFTATNGANISTIAVTYGDYVAPSVASPVISLATGTYLEAQTVTLEAADGLDIYYTLDGTDPTTESIKYTEAITISETTTLKAIAVDAAGTTSKVATATYTFPEIIANIAAFMEANTTAYLKLEGAQVVYIDGAKKNIYVRDASGAIDLYNNKGFDTELQTGDLLSGVLYGKYSPYKNLPEIANVDLSEVKVTGNETVVAKEIEASEFDQHYCDLVVIKNTTITSNNNKYYIADGAIQLYDGFKLGLEFEAGLNVDVAGIAVIYDTTKEIYPRFTTDITYLATSEEVGIGAEGYATFSSTKALDFTGKDAIKAYVAEIAAESDVVFVRVNKIPANTGVLLVSAAGGAVEPIAIPYLEDEAESVEGNLFVAATTEIAALESEANGQKNYILQAEPELGFYPAAGQKVAAGKAYISVPATAGVKNFNLPALATAVESLRANAAQNVILNLAGQRVNKAVKGIYIVNGKKVVMK